MEIKRLDLGDGDYALALAEETHRTHQALDKLWEVTVGGRAKWNEIKKQVNAAKTPVEQAAILTSYCLTNDDELWILNQVKEIWINGKSLPVTHETLYGDEMSSTKYEILRGEVDKLYTQVPLVPQI
jgi:hypothetical protein